MDIKLDYTDLCGIASQVSKKDFTHISSFSTSVTVFLHGIRFVVHGYHHTDNTFEASYIVCKPKRYEMDCDYDERSFKFAFRFNNVEVA